MTLPGHKGDVSALDFVQGSGTSRCIVSGDATGAVKVWKEHGEQVRTSGPVPGATGPCSRDTHLRSRGPRQWTPLATLTAHEASVSAVFGLQLSAAADNLLILSGGSDSTIRVSRVTPSGQGTPSSSPNRQRVARRLTSKKGYLAELLQTISTNGKIPLALALTTLPSSRGAMC